MRGMLSCMTAQYTMNVWRKTMQKWYENYVESNAAPPPTHISIQELPPAIIGAILICDGQPAANVSSVIAADNMKLSVGE